MEKLTVLCFAGTYALALLAETTRFAARLRETAGRIAPVALTALGWAVHTAYLGNLAAHARAVPVTTAFESLLVLGWVLAAIALYLMARGGRVNAAGPIVLGLTLADLVVAALWAPRGGSWASLGGWMRFWGSVHGIFLLLGAVCTCLAFVFGLTYLAQARRLKLKRPAGRGVALPSLEQSERWNRAAITLAFPLLTAGLIIGAGLTLATGRAGGTRLAWTDPKVLSMLAVWVVFAALLHARYRPDWRGRRVMVLTLVAFAFLAFAMVGVGLILPTAHGGVASGVTP